MHMDCVGNQSRVNIPTRKGRTDKPGFTISKLAHRVEQMRDTGRARIKSGHARVEISVSVPK